MVRVEPGTFGSVVGALPIIMSYSGTSTTEYLINIMIEYMLYELWENWNISSKFSAAYIFFILTGG